MEVVLQDVSFCAETLNFQVASSSKTLVAFYQAMQCYI